ncbi:MAG: hypothetical protein K2O18_07235 [Oscillospiraceae bacterium]|nr:hypothetical protein [Oscillospiraceae bacterium]
MTGRDFLDDFDEYTCGQCADFCRYGDSMVGECTLHGGLTLTADAEACPDFDLED